MAEERALAPECAELIEELAGLFRTSEGIFGCDEMFDYMARRTCEVQRATNPVLRRFWDASGGSAPAVWHEIPPVPVAAFKDMPIVSGAAEVVYRTSGTSGGGQRPASTMSRASTSIAPRARRIPASLFGAGYAVARARATVSLVSLVPHPTAAPDSSLSAMAGFVAQEPEIAHATWAFHPQRGLDAEAVIQATGEAPHPILLLTTAFALVHLLDALDESPLRLPPGSRVMETGGFKGRAAEVDRATLYQRVQGTLAVPESHIVNEYGMTEMLSQAYDGVAGDASPVAERIHRFPLWVRTRALDPLDLTPLPPGETGLLAHFDLANAASVCHLLTEDLGRVTRDGGVELVGRAPGADLRGSRWRESFLRRRRPAGSTWDRVHGAAGQATIERPDPWSGRLGLPPKPAATDLSPAERGGLSRGPPSGSGAGSAPNPPRRIAQQAQRANGSSFVERACGILAGGRGFPNPFPMARVQQVPKTPAQSREMSRGGRGDGQVVVDRCAGTPRPVRVSGPPRPRRLRPGRRAGDHGYLAGDHPPSRCRDRSGGDRYVHDPGTACQVSGAGEAWCGRRGAHDAVRAAPGPS